MTNAEGCFATMLACILALAIYVACSLGISFLIAKLVVGMGLLNVGVGRLTLLIWLVKMLFFNFNASYCNKRKND